MHGRIGLIAGVGLLLGTVALLHLFADDPEEKPERGATVADPDAAMRDRLKTIPWDKMEILVVQGECDHVELVLAALKIPHKNIAFEGFQGLLTGKKAALLQGDEEEPGKAAPPGVEKLDPRRHIVVINCTSQELTDKEGKSLEAFVARGGYLLTTDWSLAILAAVFSDYVRMDENEVLDDTHQVKLKASSLKHPLLADLRRPDAAFDWWFEGGSFAARVKDKRAVTVLAFCPDYDDTPVALTWEMGANVSAGARGARGRVLHFVSHLEQQEFDEDGAYNLQMAFLNFVKLKGRDVAGGK